MPVIYHHRKNVKHYPLPGRKCPLCSCYSATNIDYEAHMKTHWRKARNGEGEWLPAEGDPDLAKMLNIVGILVKGGYRYTLIADGKIIYRTKTQY